MGTLEENEKDMIGNLLKTQKMHFDILADFDNINNNTSSSDPLSNMIKAKTIIKPQNSSSKKERTTPVKKLVSSPRVEKVDEKNSGSNKKLKGGSMVSEFVKRKMYNINSFYR